MNILTSKLTSFFKKKQFIRFYTLEPGVAKLYPIQKSRLVKRDWLKIKQEVDTNTKSSQNCPGIQKIINTGYILTAPADFIIKTNGDGVSVYWDESYQFNKCGQMAEYAYINTHNSIQTEPLLNDKDNILKTVIKVETPWRVEVSNNIILLIMPVAYNNEDRFEAATGFLDPSYMHVLNVQLYWKKLNDEILIKAGTPLCQILPIDKKILQDSTYTFTVEEATSTDYKLERDFVYASNSSIYRKDSVLARIKRLNRILTKGKK